MATCRTCRGEYLESQTRCPRCKSETVSWQKAQIDFKRFCKQGGFAVLLLPFVAPAPIILLLSQLLPATIVGYVVTYFLLVIISYFSIMSIYGIRYLLREHWWDVQVRDRGLSPVVLAVLGFVVGIGFLITASIIAQTARAEPSAATIFLFFALCVLGFILLITAITFSVVLMQIDRLDNEVPPPLYVDINKLLHVTLREARDSLRDPDVPVDEYTVYRLRAVTVERTADLGIDVLVHGLQREPQFDVQKRKDDEQTAESNFWRIKADKWGRIRSLKPEACPHHFHLIGGFPEELD